MPNPSLRGIMVIIKVCKNTFAILKKKSSDLQGKFYLNLPQKQPHVKFVQMNTLNLCNGYSDWIRNLYCNGDSDWIRNLYCNGDSDWIRNLYCNGDGDWIRNLYYNGDSDWIRNLYYNGDSDWIRNLEW